MILEYIILGLIQGFTEFLPVSSSGHLVIAQKILGLSGEEVALSVILHMGTFLAILVFFFRDLLKVFKNIRLLLLIMLVTLITGIVGFIGKEFFEGLFLRPQAVAWAWLATGLVLLLTQGFVNGTKSTINFKDASWLGITQAIAIMPGVSRSGITISTLLFRKVDKTNSFILSFIVGLPVIFGAGILEAQKIGFVLKEQSLGLGIGFLVSFMAGTAALILLKKVMDQARFHYFGYYCIAIAVLTLIFVK